LIVRKGTAYNNVCKFNWITGNWRKLILLNNNRCPSVPVPSHTEDPSKSKCLWLIHVCLCHCWRSLYYTIKLILIIYYYNCPHLIKAPLIKGPSHQRPLSSMAPLIKGPSHQRPLSSTAPLIKGHPFYQTRFHMHWNSKILLNCPQEKPPLF
jgi:hypothetical protein